MSDNRTDAEPTHALPPELVESLLKASDWYNRRYDLERTIRTYGGIAERNQADLDDNAREAAPLLEEIVEIIDRTWGFAVVRSER